jgi:protein-tyrosine phosphatase
MENIYWIRHAEPSRLAIVDRPSADHRMEDDLIDLKDRGIDVLVSLLRAHEARELGLEEERESAEALGLEFVSYPIPDGSIPADLKSFRKFILQLVDAIRAGKSVGTHCRGCIGRSTVTTAAVLIELGWRADDALEMIEEARGWRVPDTLEQRDWIQRYAPEWSVR